MNTSGRRVWGGLTLSDLGLTGWATVLLARLTEARPANFVGFRDSVTTLAPGRLDMVWADLDFGLTVRIFAAFLALAFPAGERLVAGLRRVDLPATTRLRDDAAADEWREVERDASFFTLLAIGLLIRKALDSMTIHHKDRRKKRRELNIAAALIQRKNRVCGLQLDTLFKQYGH